MLALRVRHYDAARAARSPTTARAARSSHTLLALRARPCSRCALAALALRARIFFIENFIFKLL